MGQIEITYDQANYLFTLSLDSTLEIVKDFHDVGIDVNVKYNESKTPLMIAVSDEDIEMIKFLLKHGASVNEKSNTGWTALHYAVFSGEKEIVEILLQNKADFTARDYEYGNNALDWAIIYGLYEIAQLLIEHGAQVSDEHVLSFINLMEKKKRDAFEELFKNQ